MLKFRYAIFALLLWATPFAAYAQDANQVPSLATFRANAYGGTVWLAGNVTPGDGGQGYFLPNGKQSVTHCVDNGATVIVDKNGTCWDRQSWGGAPVGTPSMVTVPTIAALENIGVSAGANVTAAYVPGIGIYQWNATSTATPDPSDTPQTIVQVTGDTTGRMVLQNGAIGNVANIAALEALPDAPIGMTVNVGGYTTPGDGGGGSFTVIAGTLIASNCTGGDGGTTFGVASSAGGCLTDRYWERDFKINLNIAWFGPLNCTDFDAAVAAGEFYGVGVNLDGKTVTMDCVDNIINSLSTYIKGPGTLDSSALTSANTGQYVYKFEATLPDSQTQSAESRLRPFRFVRLLGPTASTGVNAITFLPTSCCSGDIIASGFEFDNITASGWANLYTTTNGNVYITFNHNYYSNDTGIASGTFLQLDGTTNSGENFTIANSFIDGTNAFIVDRSANPNTDVYVSNTSADGEKYIFTGDTGSGPGSTCAFSHVTFKGHIEDWAGTDYAINLCSGGVFDWNGGQLAWHGIDAYPFANLQVKAGGAPSYLSIKNVRDGLDPNTFELFADGQGTLLVNGVFHSGNAAYPLFGEGNNLIPDWLINASALSYWATGGGAVTVDTTTFPPSDGFSPAGTGAIKAVTSGNTQDAVIKELCKPGQQLSVSIWYKTTGVAAAGGTWGEILSYYDGLGNDLSSTYYSSTTDTAAWTNSNNISLGNGAGGEPAPPGTMYAALDLQASSPAGTTETVWWGKPQMVCQ